MSNTNCLAGMARPECRSEGPFVIAVTVSALVFDDGFTDIEGGDWSDNSSCQCSECLHSATVSQFYEPPAPAQAGSSK
jgi:hypothetical protein